MTRRVFSGAVIFDGTRLHHGMALVTEGGRIATIVAEATRVDGEQVRLAGGILAPGMIDLQVNGGAGLMVGANSTADSLAEICAAHAGLGATGILPTLITDRPEVTESVIAAGRQAAQKDVAGFLGLHIEGPHLDPRRKGAHDAALIRPMTDADEALLLQAVADLPALLVTVAPESVTPDRIARLVRAGVRVSLGHSDCDHATALRAIDAGASMATHLFNAMSQITPRDPGLVGTVLDSGLAAGLIADGIHVHPANLRLALAAGGDGVFLVSDAMAVAGTNLTGFELGRRRIERGSGRLSLIDGTLAGADLTLPRAVAVLRAAGAATERALAMATRIPARLIGAQAGELLPGRPADLAHLDDSGALIAVWRNGKPLSDLS